MIIDSGLKDDLLNGVKDFADFTGIPRRRMFYMLEKGMLPAGKLGGKWAGSKTRVREHLARITRGGAA